jgi:catechol-2,3-dioxygenase
MQRSSKRRHERARTATGRGTRARHLIDDVTGILLVSAKAKALADFYRATLGLPMVEEIHDGSPLHYGCSLGDVHFAIHDAEGWPGRRSPNSRSPVVAFSTSRLKEVTRRLSARGVKLTGPADHGFGEVASFRDPDGNQVLIVEYGPEHW